MFKVFTLYYLAPKDASQYCVRIERTNVEEEKVVFNSGMASRRCIDTIDSFQSNK